MIHGQLKMGLEQEWLEDQRQITFYVKILVWFEKWFCDAEKYKKNKRSGS